MIASSLVEPFVPVFETCWIVSNGSDIGLRLRLYGGGSSNIVYISLISVWCLIRLTFLQMGLSYSLGFSGIKVTLL